MTAEASLLAIAIKSESRGPMISLDRAEVSTEAGIAGDARGGVRARQVTLVAKEAWQRACEALGADIPWTARRANLMLEGIDLKQTEGRVLHVGAVKLEITGETLPCSRMDEFHDGLREALEPEWRAGATAMVLHPGTIHPGDPVSWEPAPGR